MIDNEDAFMTIKLTSDEQKLVEYAKKAVIKYNRMRHKKGGVDTLYSFLLSDSGKIYDGACLEPNIAQATICGERHAIANTVLDETYKAKIKCIIVADPVPEMQKKLHHSLRNLQAPYLAIWHAQNISHLYAIYTT